MRELPSGIVTFLFSDIEGSTRLLDELGAQRYAEALAEHRQLMREAFTTHGGVEVDTQGDAFFVAFSDARGAVAAAAQAQQTLSGGPIAVRMGLHTGEPHVTGEGYVGIDVHRGARVMSAGHGGQVLLSEVTYALLDGSAGLTDLGLHRLKDLTEPQRLWQLGGGEFPPLKTLYQTNLPVQPTPLVGREGELAELLGLLEDSRLVTLTGAGGSGKTRLALQAAAELVDDYADGVWWVSLAALRSPELVEPTIAQVVGAKDGLAEYLRTKRTLLLLDNFEQVVAAAPSVAALLAEAPDLRVLATSRERLALAAEREFPVPTLIPSEAAELFTTRARQLKPQFEPDEAVAEICRRLDGLPLAIELAAARIKLLSPERILERLGSSLDVLTRGARDAPARQQTLRATIEWSYDLLDESQRELFARLGVFSGSFSLDAAEEVCAADLDDLQALVEKSLLRPAPDDRFFMLETIREFAIERFEGSGDAEELRSRHANHFARLAEEHEPLLRTSEVAAALSAFSQDEPNLRAAIDAAGQLDAELQGRLCAACWYFWARRAQFREGIERLGAALERQPSRPVAAALHEGLTMFESLSGNAAAAVGHADRALALRREEGDPKEMLRALLNRGGSAEEAGDVGSARLHYEECAETARQVDDRWFLAASLGSLGSLALVEGDVEEAVERDREALQITYEIGDATLTAEGEMNLAFAELESGNAEAAARHFRSCLDAGAELEMPDLQAVSVLGVAALKTRTAPDDAARLLRAVTAWCAETGREWSGHELRVQERLEKATEGLSGPTPSIAEAADLARAALE